MAAVALLRRKMDGWRGHIFAAIVAMVFTGSTAAMLFVWRDFPMVADQANRAERATLVLAQTQSSTANSLASVAASLADVSKRLDRVEDRINQENAR